LYIPLGHVVRTGRAESYVEKAILKVVAFEGIGRHPLAGGDHPVSYLPSVFIW
jgi:hypothetical protein